MPASAAVAWPSVAVSKEAGVAPWGRCSIARPTMASMRWYASRIDPAAAGDLVDGVVARRFEMRGRAMDGWLAVDPAAAQTDEALREWVAHGVAYVRSLPPK